MKHLATPLLALLILNTCSLGQSSSPGISGDLLFLRKGTPNSYVAVTPALNSILAWNGSGQPQFIGQSTFVTPSALATALTPYLPSTTAATLYATAEGLATGLGTKEGTITAGTTGQIWQGNKVWIDKASLPVSTATTTALNLKANLAGGQNFTGGLVSDSVNTGDFEAISGAASVTVGTGEVLISLGADATGDMFYRGAGGNLTRIAAGTNGHVLTMTGGAPGWAAGGGTYTGTTNQVIVTGSVLSLPQNVHTGASPTFANITATGSLTAQGGNITAPVGNFIAFASSTRMAAPANGTLTLTNSGASGFTSLQFGGSTSSFPAIKRNGTSLEAWLADSSTYSPFRASIFDANAGGYGNPAIRGGGSGTYMYLTSGDMAGFVGGGGATLGGFVSAGGQSAVQIGDGPRLYSETGLGQRDGVNAQVFRVYNTWTSATNYERGKFGFDGTNVLKLGTEKGSGGGTARSLEIQTDGTARITITASGGIIFAGLPTSSPGVTGQLWNDSGVLKVSP